MRRGLRGLVAITDYIHKLCSTWDNTSLAVIGVVCGTTRSIVIMRMNVWHGQQRVGYDRNLSPTRA